MEGPLAAEPCDLVLLYFVLRTVIRTYDQLVSAAVIARDSRYPDRS